MHVWCCVTVCVPPSVPESPDTLLKMSVPTTDSPAPALPDFSRMTEDEQIAYALQMSMQGAGGGQTDICLSVILGDNLEPIVYRQFRFIADMRFYSGGNHKAVAASVPHFSFTAYSCNPSLPKTTLRMSRQTPFIYIVCLAKSMNSVANNYPSR